MSLHALIAAAACAVSLFVGLWHVLVYRRGTRDRLQLAFALACFAIGLFDIARIGNYLTDGTDATALWQLGEQLAGALLAIPLVWFIVLVRRERRYWFAHTVSAYFACVALLIVLGPRALLLRAEPRITHVALPWGAHVTYSELQHGPLLAIVSSLSGAAILAVIVHLALPLRPEGQPDRKQVKLLRIGMTAFLLGALNDIAVSIQLYRFLYLMEIAYLGLILVVTWGMSNSVIELASTRAELRREHLRLQRIFENINEIYFETTIDGIIREVSPSIQRVAGLPQDLRGKSMLQYYVPSSQRDDLLSQLKENGKVTDFAATLRIASGELRDAEISAVLVRDEQTAEPLVLGTIRDITARRRAEAAKADLERQLQQAQKLESLGVLAGGIAHDFNNLLAGILGSTELARLKLGQDHPVAEVLEISIQSCQRAADLCRLMLAYSGRGRFVVTSVDLSRFVREMRELLAVSVSKQTRLEYQLAEQPIVIEADQAQLNQVLVNLVINASEAMGESGGRVRIATRVLDCDARQLASEHMNEPAAPGRYGLLEVQDDGIGMDEETRRRLFDPFFSTKFSGRGLGLAAVLGIVRAHRGSIQVKSKLGGGSTFRIFLPTSTMTRTEADSIHLQDSAWRGDGEALVIDDELAVCETTAKLLEVLGYRVTSTTDAVAAVSLFCEAPERFRVAIVDMTMPDLTGEEVLTQLRSRQPDLPVVVISGYSEDEVMPSGGRSIRTAFLQKPFTLEMLRGRIRHVVDGMNDTLTQP